MPDPQKGPNDSTNNKKTVSASTFLNANNSSLPFSIVGTNTYLIGKGPRKVLLDTGEGKPEYIPLLQKALDQELKGATISKVICSHWHHDHVGGVQDVLNFLAARNIHLKGSPAATAATVDTGSSSSTFRPIGLTNTDPSSSTGLPGIYKFPCPEHDDEETQFQKISDQEEIQVDDQTTLITLHTPGHTTDHCSFYLKEENTLFTADCVLGQGTAVFEDLSSYIKSLEKQLTLGNSNNSTTAGSEDGQEPLYKIYPGHGPVIEDGPAKIREYIKHRLDREKQILGVLSTATTTSEEIGSTTTAAAAVLPGKTAMQIVEVIYQAYPKNLYPAAEHQVLLHLQKLERDGKVKRDSATETSEDVWEPIQAAQASL